MYDQFDQDLSYSDAVGDGRDPWLWNTPEYGTGYISPGGYDSRVDIDDDVLAAASGLGGDLDGYAALEELADDAERTLAASSVTPMYRGAPEQPPATWAADNVDCYACAFGGVVGGWMVQHGYMVQVADKVLPTVRAGRVLAATGLLLGVAAAVLWSD